MNIFIEKENKRLALAKHAIRVADLLLDLGIKDSTVIVVKNGTVVLEDELLEQEDDIQILSVVSGG